MTEELIAFAGACLMIAVLFVACSPRGGTGPR
jgi:hypothetical protein